MFKVGDKVRVREDLEVDEEYGTQKFVRHMRKYRGEVMEIGSVWNAEYYLKEDQRHWSFTEEMLEPITDPLAAKVGDKVRVRGKKDLRRVTRTIDKQRERYAGEVLTITEILGGNYITEENEVWWRGETLEPIEDPLADKIEERNNKPTDIVAQGVPYTIDEFFEEQEQEEKENAIKPAHYRKGEIDLFESWYRTRPFNEFRAGMQMIAERYMKRDKENRIQDLDKAIYSLTRLKEYEEVQHERATDSQR